MDDIISRENTQKRLEEIEAEIEELKIKRSDLSARWNLEKNTIQDIRSSKELIENAKLRAEEFERKGELAKVAEIRYGEIHDLQNKLKKASENLEILNREGKMLKEEVGAEDIAEVLAKWTGIPVNKMLETERVKLLKIEDRLRERVIGQDEAVEVVANSIRRSRAGLQDAEKPIGSFIFLGSTGVGKTELAKTLAEYLFDDENAMIRIDMSEYMEKYSASKLIGAPPGYVGYDEGGQLTEAVRRRPYSVVLLDEIEKANPEVFNILLQVLDDGRLTDGKGRTVNFKNTIIIMTSNLGSEIIGEGIDKMEYESPEIAMLEIKRKMTELLKKSLRPEFLNRIDEIVFFNPLSRENISEIAKLQVAGLLSKLKKENIELTIGEDVYKKLAQFGYDAHFGARPLKRVVQKSIVDPLAVEILSNNILPGDRVLLYLDGSGKAIFDKIEK
jgi:ATP-dependent Clp protease ATP-binding subunit ClpB